MTVNRARFTIDGSPSEDPSTGDRGVDVLAGQTIAITLEQNPARVLSVEYSLPNEANEEAPYQSLNFTQQLFDENGLSVLTSTDPNATFHITVDALTEMSSYVIRCKTVDDTGTHIFERMISVRGADLRMTVPAERQEYEMRGWSNAMNEMALAIALVLGGGSGLVVGGVPSIGYVPTWNGASAVWAAGGGSLPSIATDRLLGRDTAGTGAAEEISLNATLSFTGAGAIQRAALTGDVTAAAGSNATTIANAVVTPAKMADLAAASVLGRATNTSGVMAAISSSADGQVLRRAAGAIGWGALDLADADARTGVLPVANGGTNLSALGTSLQVLRTNVGATDTEWATISTLAAGSATGQTLIWNGATWGAGALDLADADARTGLLPHANIANLAGLSVFARSANTAGVMAAITGTDGQALRVSGTTLGFGTLVTAAYADASVTLAKLANGTASSVLGRSAASGGVYADIVSSADGQVLRRGASGVIAFGALDLADADARTGLLPFANIADGAAASVFGRAGATSGVQASIAASADGQVLQQVAGALAFAPLAVANLGGGSAQGQVLINASLNIPTWGAVNLADGDAVTGLLGIANMANLTGLSVLGRSSNTTGVMGAIPGTDGQALRVSGTTLAFGTLATAAYADNSVTLAKLPAATALSVLGRASSSGGVYADIVSSADGQVLRRSGSAISFGALDLADADAVTGLLPGTNVNPNFGSQNIVTTGTIQTGSATYLEVASLATNREIISVLLGADLSTTQMPANTGDKVIFLANATTAPTTGFPVGGGILFSDASLGLEWKGANGVETTIAPQGPSGNTTKRRIVDWKSRPVETTTNATTQITAASFAVNSFNGSSFGASGGSLLVRAKCITFSGGANYTSYVELMCLINQSTGSAASVDGTGVVPGMNDANGILGNDISAATIDIDADNVTVRLRITPNSGDTMTHMAFFEVMAAEM
jgi:hypothetical protein